jgi:ABC-type Fe3+/spermidine/putrescine transport system ATPase subunit
MNIGAHGHEGPDLEVFELTKRFGSAAAVDRVSFRLNKGEFLSLLGPSGCGKTTTLRMIAGFITPDSGSIRLRGRDIANVAPYHRDVGLLFQSYALFPHMNVLDNIAFGPRMQGLARAKISEKARWALDLVRMSGYETRKPSELSGGQQQRVAVARVVAAGASILLLDEPFSNLDAKLRKHMQEDLRELQLRLGIGTIHVTHDQEEAMSMSDRLIIMSGGRIEQEGAAEAVYRSPRTAFVAGFMGRTNDLDARLVSYDPRASVAELDTAFGRLVAHWSTAPDIGATVRVFMRPEHVALTQRGGFAGRQNVFPGEIARGVFLGPSTAYHLRLPGEIIIVAQQPNPPGEAQLMPRGTQVDVHIPPGALKPLRD